MSTDLYQKLKNLALAYVKAHDEPTPWDPDNLWRYRSEDSVQSLHPKESIPSAFTGDLTKDHYYQALYFFGSIISKSRFDVDHVVVDVEQRKAVVSINAKLDLRAVGDEPAEDGWPASYCLIIVMDEKAEKIVRVDEYLDAGRLMGHVQPKAEKYAQMK